MPVEIREVVLKARVVGPESDDADRDGLMDPSELKRQILADCERMIRAALARSAAR